MIDALLGLTRFQKRTLAVLVDGVLCVGSTWCAYYLRLGEWTWLVGSQWLSVAAALVIALPIFVRAGLYRAIFRYSGLRGLGTIAIACLIYGSLYSLIFTFVGIEDVPRTVGFIQPALLFLMVAATRAAAQYLLGGSYRALLAEDKAAPRVLIYGAGDAGRQVLAALRKSKQMRVAGFLDDDRSLQGGTIGGLFVHNPGRLQSLVASHGVNEVLLALPSVSRRRRREVLEMLRAAGVSVKTLPGLADLAHGRVQVNDIRPLEIEDLLGRDQVPPNRELIEAHITGKTVMVTGGGGSIGGELCRQILALGPSRLIIFDASEYALYAIHRELTAILARGQFEPVNLVPLLGSVENRDLVEAIFRQWRPETIYHAAAYKHVPLVEHNVVAALRNNVLGTRVAAEAAMKYGVSDFVLVSTDKAVRPTNVMGASKRLGEMILQAHAAAQDGTCFSMVRFGNVLGSSGSVVPLFRQQIADGGPVTITHDDVTRYFMTIREAAELVIQAGAMAKGGEVFVLDMGEPVLVRDLAANMIQLSGLSVRSEANPEGDIEIEVIGLRPGEKLYEELLIGEDQLPTHHERIAQAYEHFLGLPELEPGLAQMTESIVAGDVRGCVATLKRLVAEYQSSSKFQGGAVDEPEPACPRLASSAAP